MGVLAQLAALHRRTLMSENASAAGGSAENSAPEIHGSFHIETTDSVASTVGESVIFLLAGFCFLILSGFALACCADLFSGRLTNLLRACVGGQQVHYLTAALHFFLEFSCGRRVLKLRMCSRAPSSESVSHNQGITASSSNADRH